MLRNPKAKKKLGLKVPPMPMPHIELVQHQVMVPDEVAKNQKTVKEDTGYTSTTDTTGYTKSTDTTNTTDTSEQSYEWKKKQSLETATSPEKDFQKVPNSITRNILANGLFRGKSKQIYDYLWSVSRGAIQPKREVQKTHKEIMNGAGIGSRNTIVNGMKHLQSIGLIYFESDVGKSGAIFIRFIHPKK